MAAAISLRQDYSGADLRRLARISSDANQTRRFLALVLICDGGSRSDAAKLGGVTLQVVRDWVIRFNTEGADGLVNRKAPGATPTLTDEHRAALAKAVEDGPDHETADVVRWRLTDLAQWLHDEFGVSVSRFTVGRELATLGYAKLSTRPRHHAQDPDAVDNFKKTSPKG